MPCLTWRLIILFFFLQFLRVNYFYSLNRIMLRNSFVRLKKTHQFLSQQWDFSKNCHFTHWLIGWLADWKFSKILISLIGWLVDWKFSKILISSTGWLVDWLIGWLEVFPKFPNWPTQFSLLFFLRTDADPFNRDGFARQSMSEKRHAHVDPRSLDTYRRSKAALAENRATAGAPLNTAAKSHTPSPSHGPDADAAHLRRANSLESVVQGPSSAGGVSGSGDSRRKPGKAGGSAGRNRGCNESFRVAVDRSYEAEQRAGEEELNERTVSFSSPTTTSPMKPRSHSKDDSIEILESPADGSKKQVKKTFIKSTK